MLDTNPNPNPNPNPSPSPNPNPSPDPNPYPKPKPNQESLLETCAKGLAVWERLRERGWGRGKNGAAAERKRLRGEISREIEAEEREQANAAMAEERLGLG